MGSSRTLLNDFRDALIEENRCPECLGRLNPELRCILCRYDAFVEYERGGSVTEEEMCEGR